MLCVVFVLDCFTFLYMVMSLGFRVLILFLSNLKIVSHPLSYVQGLVCTTLSYYLQVAINCNFKTPYFNSKY